MQRLITARRNIILNAFRINNAAVRPHNPHLLRKKGMIRSADLHLASAAL